MERHLIGMKEPELVCKVEWYQLDIVRLTSTHSMGSETKLLERAWTLILWSCPWKEALGRCGNTHEPLAVLQGDSNAYVGNNAVIWRDIIGRNRLPDQNPGSILFFYFCASHGLSITNTMFVHKLVHKCIWY